MSVHKLFLNEDCRGSLGWGGGYTYEAGVLEIDWYGKRSWHYVPPRSAVFVKPGENGPVVGPLEAPKSYPGKLLWLCGVPRAARCRSPAEYDTMVEGHADSPVRHLGGRGWQIAKGLDPEGRDYIVAGWVDPGISARQCRRMLRQCGAVAPDWFVDKLLSGKWR